MLTCKHCGSDELMLRGKRRGKQRFKCTKCGKFSTVIFVPRIDVPAKILLLDIETAPGEYYSWSREPNYLPPEMMIKDWSILCWSAKWLFSPEIMGESVTPREAVDRTEGSILEKLWGLMNEAHIIVTQNGDKFDLKKINSKLIKHGYPPPSNYASVDTLKTAKDRFGNTYNSLEELGREFLGVEEGKIKMNMSDWKRCVRGNEQREYLEKMLTYCKNDVAPLLEDVYLVMRPWIKNHPNLNLYTNHDDHICPKCASTNLNWAEEYRTPQGWWMGFRCLQCGSLGRGNSQKLHRVKAVNITPI